MLEMFDHQVHELFVLQMAGGTNDHVAGSKSLLVEIPHRIAFEFLYRVFGSQDRLAQRMILPEILGEDFMDQIVRIVLIHLDLFQNHAPLASDILRVKDRVQHQVAEHVHGDRQMLVQHFDVEADTFLGGEGVHVAADGIHLARNFLRGAMLRTLEHHVLDEMGNAVPLQVFIARPGLDPYPDRGGANVLHLLGDEGQPVGQDLATYIPNFLDHELLSTGSGANGPVNSHKYCCTPWLTPANIALVI